MEDKVNTYVALFRGINVGGNNILPMKELASILVTLGYENVRTYIQSGNVVFTSKKTVGEKAAGAIGLEILRKYGFSPKVLLLSAEQLQQGINNNPYATDDGKALHFYFLEHPPGKPNMEQLNSLKAASEEFALVGKVFYLHAPNGIGRSKLAAAVEKLVGVPVTARNWNTVNKLASMIEMA